MKSTDQMSAFGISGTTGGGLKRLFMAHSAGAFHGHGQNFKAHN